MTSFCFAGCRVYALQNDVILSHPVCNLFSFEQTKCQDFVKNKLGTWRGFKRFENTQFQRELYQF